MKKKILFAGPVLAAAANQQLKNTTKAKTAPLHHWDKYRNEPRPAKVMPKHFRGHNPPPQFCANVLNLAKQDFAGDVKVKLYVLRKPTAYNQDVSTEVHHGVKLRNINRVLSKCRRHEQAAAFYSTKGAHGRPVLVKIYS